MRIFSNFRDYYDIGLQYGIDPNCKYIRKTETFNDNSISIQNIINFLFKQVGIGNMPYAHSKIEAQHLILFCGRLFYCVEFYRIIDYVISEITFVYNHKHLRKYISKLGDKNITTETFGRKKEHKSRYWYGGFNRISVFELLDRFPTEKNDSLIQLSIDQKSPIIQYTKRSELSGKLIFNPSLKDIEFFKVLSPVDAFQELSMFISGVMGGESPPMVKVSDGVRLEKHGFDKKDSFRNTKGRLK